MDTIKTAMENLNDNVIDIANLTPISFNTFLEKNIENPERIIRNVFQIFHDMVLSYLGIGEDEYPEDPESIQFVKYDCHKLFVEGSDHPYFADRLFANRFVSMVKALKRGAQQNMVYIFKGPPGCGKSTFLNNLLMRFEEYCNTEKGMRYEIVWRFSHKMFGDISAPETNQVIDKLNTLINKKQTNHNKDFILKPGENLGHFNDYFDIPCPSHDHPLLIIPQKYRRQFLGDMFAGTPFKNKLFNTMEYDWVFRDTPCAICTSIYQILLNQFRTPEKVFEAVFARPYLFNRQLGEGISVFNPGDEPISNKPHQNEFIQNRLNNVLREGSKIKYVYSQYAKTNNGIYGIMDIKSHNTQRLIELHNIISEGLHKVLDIEENVHSLLIAVMNPEDQKNIQDFKSFTDRTEYINIPYVMDLSTEVEIYRNTFGTHIDNNFLPHVLRNFTRVIISTRINQKSKTLFELIQNPAKYSLYCDKDLNLLKMEFYTGNIPDWLSEEDRKRFSAKMRRKIIGEGEFEGDRGISGRDSIRYFNEFYSTYAKENRHINMADLVKFFTHAREDLKETISQEFLDSLQHLYDYKVLHEVKESLYYYNKQQISTDIQDYLFAVNFEIGSIEKSRYTNNKLDITEDFFKSIELRILGKKATKERCEKFRTDTQKEYTTMTLPQEILLESKTISKTKIFDSLFERYVYNLKEKALDPFLENDNFRRAIKDYNEKDFKTYDKRIKTDVKYLIKNLCKKFHYTEKGARDMCIYVIDNNLAKKFEK